MINATHNKRPDKRALQNRALESVLGFAERIAKILTIFVATIYIIGYVVTSTRLAEYSVPATRLIDAQYFVAGLLPGLLLWLTISVSVLAFLYTSRKKEEDSTRSLNWVGWGILILFVVGLLMELFLVPYSKGLGAFGSSLVNVTVSAAKVVIGELALWFLIVGLRGNFFAKLNEWSKSWGEPWSGHFIAAILLALVALALFQIARSGQETYAGLPQAYGGGKPLRIELYVDGNKVPGELLIAKPDAGGDSPARTVPLNLILQTSAEYVVDPLDDNRQRVWVLKADAIHAVHIIEVSLP